VREGCSHPTADVAVEACSPSLSSSSSFEASARGVGFLCSACWAAVRSVQGGTQQHAWATKQPPCQATRSGTSTRTPANTQGNPRPVRVTESEVVVVA
jgi:hypothetical protein